MHLYSFLKTIHKLLICNLALLDRWSGWNYRMNALLLLFHSVIWVERMPCHCCFIRLFGQNERLALAVSFGCLGGRTPCFCCIIRLFERTHEPCVPTCLQRFPCKGEWSAGEIWVRNQQDSWRFRCLFSLWALHSQSVYRKPHGGFVVFLLFMFRIPNTHIANHLAVSLFILSLCSTFPICIS